MRVVAALLLGIMLAACSQQAAAPLNAPTFIAEGNPPQLSDWGMVQASQQRLVLSEGVTPYDLNTPLFTDYAQKLRTIWMPEGQSAEYDASDVFDFPIGTVITKTFFYQRGAGERVLQDADQPRIHDEAGQIDLRRVRLIETRVLARRETGWIALTYVWNEEQTAAALQRTGAVLPLELVRANGEIEPFRYVVPNVTQCAACHAPNVATREIRPIGPKARHLNRDYVYDGVARNQLEHLASLGYLHGFESAEAAPRNAVWTDAGASLEARARAYLDANCSHCPNRDGPAETSGLYLDPATPIAGNFGVCKLPVAAGSGTGNRRFDIVPGDPDASVMPYRMASTDPAVMMPEIGRSTAHSEG
ncbi:MAG TPA: SO2930 family diheme c-type cytochrome, partial [Verrucomicrobiae bacterium]|nr:SO2930 family diheme c-type cytochrome [Verrucomicrobiae bacterium]